MLALNKKAKRREDSTLSIYFNLCAHRPRNKLCTIFVNTLPMESATENRPLISLTFFLAQFLTYKIL